MKKLRYTILALVITASLSLVSCADEKKEQVETVETQDGNNDPANTEKDQLVIEEAEIVFDNTGMKTVFERYLDVKNALVKTNSAEAKEAASELTNTLKNISATEAAVQASETIAASEDVNAQREAFSTLSAEIETLIDGSISSGAIYQQYCPMAFEGNGGYWLSTSKEIRNPYYGDKMLKCGSVKKTFE